MLLAKVLFDKKCPNWTSEYSWNFKYLKHVETRINDDIHYRGYIYLNQIYEFLGIKWDCDMFNHCIRNDGEDRRRFVEFETFQQPNYAYEIHIYQYDKQD